MAEYDRRAITVKVEEGTASLMFNKRHDDSSTLLVS
jgi:hypothetical protein